MFEPMVMGGSDEAVKHIAIQASPQTLDASTQTSVSDVIGVEEEILMSSLCPQPVPVMPSVVPSPPDASVVCKPSVSFSAVVGSTLPHPTLPSADDVLVRTLENPTGTLVKLKPGYAISNQAGTLVRFKPGPADPPGKPKRSYISDRNLACVDPTHRVHSSAGVERQRHSCMQCFLDDWRMLKTNKFIEPWQMALILGTTTRQYVCLLCVLETEEGQGEQIDAIRKQTGCKKHSVFNRQAECTYHQKPWYQCFVCLHDPRAGKRCCLMCGLSNTCCCPPGPIKLRDIATVRVKQSPEDQVKLMKQLTKSILDYAALLQTTTEIEDPVRRAAKVLEIKATFRFPDASTLNRFLKHVM